MNYSSDNHRMAKNTLMLYFRTFLLMIVSLYTSRVVLSALGIDGYGIYNVVAGGVATFSILSGTLSGAISRFITFELGKNNINRLRATFSTSLSIQLIISLVVIVAAETVGLWFLNNYMNIPANRMIAANWVYQFSIATFVIRLLCVPFNALIISHERMSIYAYLSIIEVLLQLFIVYLLKILIFDKLETYSCLMMLTIFVILIIYAYYCRRNFIECTFKPHIDKKSFREMLEFAGWNFIGSSSGVLQVQGVDIIVNIFTNVTVNAARGIASQVNTAVARFVQSFTTALQPQIIKSYAANDKDRYHLLIMQGARFSFYLMFFLSLPAILEMDTILRIWLNDVPLYAATFTKLQIVSSLIVSLSNALIIALLSTGRIKRYQITVGALSLCNFPLSFFLLYLGLPVYFIYIVAICLEVICLGARLVFIKILTGFEIKSFINIVIINIFKVTCAATIIPVSLLIIMPSGVCRFITVVSICLIMTSVSILFIGLNKVERYLLYSKFMTIVYSKKF